MQIEYVVYQIMYVYMACVPECCGFVCCASQLSALPKHVGVVKFSACVGCFHYVYKIKFAFVRNRREEQDCMCQKKQLLWTISVVYCSTQLLSQAT
jgi:hypothetical protein